MADLHELLGKTVSIVKREPQESGRKTVHPPARVAAKLDGIAWRIVGIDRQTNTLVTRSIGNWTKRVERLDVFLRNLREGHLIVE
jgi:hypothetical protein